VTGDLPQSWQNRLLSLSQQSRKSLQRRGPKWKAQHDFDFDGDFDFDFDKEKRLKNNTCSLKENLKREASDHEDTQSNHIL
jgi:hypothetical protein